MSDNEKNILKRKSFWISTAVIIFFLIIIIPILFLLFYVRSYGYPFKWEYKLVSVEATTTGYSWRNSDFLNSEVEPSLNDFNNLGKEGWELVSSYLEMETAHPNFGSPEYVTGIQPNTRPHRTVFIFKRSVFVKNIFNIR